LKCPRPRSFSMALIRCRLAYASVIEVGQRWIEQLRYTDLSNVCSMAIAKTQQEYTLAQAR
jgi:hypothetical protein